MEQQALTNLMSDMSGTVDANYSLYQSDSPRSTIFLGQEEDTFFSSNLAPATKTIQKAFKSKKKYHNISNELRMKLIDAVENKGEKIKHASRKLGINYSSAKSICQIFKREGRSDKRTFKRRNSREDERNFCPPPPEIFYSSPYSPSKQGLDQIEPCEPTCESPDTLRTLRDRLLESRASNLKQQEFFEMPPKKMSCGSLDLFSNFQAQTSDTTNISPEAKSVQQNEQFIFQNNNIRTANESPNPEMSSYPSNSKLSQYLSPVQTQYPMPPIIFTSPQIMPINNFAIGFPQGVRPMGPSQTININNPQAGAMNIQNISLSSENKPNQQLQLDLQNSGPNLLGNQNIPMQPLQLYSIPQQQQPNILTNGNQMNNIQFMQPTFVMIPQQNNLTFMPFPQILQNKQVYNGGYNSWLPVNYSFSPTPIQSTIGYFPGNRTDNLGQDFRSIKREIQLNPAHSRMFYLGAKDEEKPAINQPEE